MLPCRIKKSPVNQTRSGIVHTSTTPLVQAAQYARGDSLKNRPRRISGGKTLFARGGTRRRVETAHSPQPPMGSRNLWRLRLQAHMDGANTSTARSSARDTRLPRTTIEAGLIEPKYLFGPPCQMPSEADGWITTRRPPVRGRPRNNHGESFAASRWRINRARTASESRGVLWTISSSWWRALDRSPVLTRAPL